MKTSKRFFASLLAAFILALICPNVIPMMDTVATAEASAKVKISKTKATLIKGQTLQLKVSGTSSKIKWTTSKTSIAAVTQNGKVTAKKKGTATITAKVGKKSYKCKVVVETPKINKTSIKLAPSDKYGLSISGSTQTIKWSSSNRNIAKVSSSGTVTAVSDGVADIAATISGKKYVCKVTVSSTATTSKISYTLEDTGRGVVAIIKNNNAMAVSIEPTMVFFKNSSTMLGTSSDYNFCLEPGAECALYFDAPYDTNYNYVSYTSYKLSLNLEKSNYSKYAASKIFVTSNKGASGVVASVNNKSSYALSTIRLAIVYYNSSGNCIGYNNAYADCESAGSTDYVSFNYPRDENDDSVVPSSYKIYVNHAYKYNYN